MVMGSKNLYEQISNVTTNYKNTIFNSAAIIFTGGVGKLTSLTTFKCPCVEPSELPEACSSVRGDREFACMSFLNFTYGLSFIVVPAIGFLVLGLLLKQKLWKALHGHRHKEQTELHERRKFFGTVLGMIFKSMIYPATWISLALLDGEFLACALTAVPYDLKTNYKDCWTAFHTNDPLTSNSYEANRRFSQTLGWILIACFIIIGFTVHLCNTYFSPFTFYHAQFYKEVKHDEEAEIQKQMKKLAEMEAAENVTQFLNKTKDVMTKQLWDRISSVYDYPVDKENPQHFTNLQDWARCSENDTTYGNPPVSTDDTKLESFGMSRFK